MDNFDCDISALQDEFTRVTVDKKPGAPRKFGGFLDQVVKMPEKDGFVIIRLLPPFPGQKLPYAPCRVHNLAPFEDRIKKKANNLYCGCTLRGKKWEGDCFFCEYYKHLYRLRDAAKNDGNDELMKQLETKAKAVKPQEKYYYNGIVMESNPPTGQSPADGPLIYSCGITLHSFILEAVLGNPEMKKKPKGNVFHPKNGRNLKVVKKMKPGGDFPDYSGSEWEDPCVLSDDDALIQKWLGSLNDVYGIRKVLGVDEMKRNIRIFEGKEIDSRKTFDASFLNEEGSSVSVPVSMGHVTTTLKSQPVVTPPVVIEEDEAPVDEEFANTVRAALGEIE